MFSKLGMIGGRALGWGSAEAEEKERGTSYGRWHPLGHLGGLNVFGRHGNIEMGSKKE